MDGNTGPDETKNVAPEASPAPSGGATETVDQNAAPFVQTPAEDTQTPDDTFVPDEAPQLPYDGPRSVTWTASEFIAHQKTAGWYGILFAGALLLAAAAWIVIKDKFSALVIILAAIVLAGYASRKPRQLEYTVDDHGINIGVKHYDYKKFRLFSIIEEDAFSSIELIPLKRFALPLTIYYPPEDEKSIAEVIALHLPFEQRKRDAIDQLMRRVRF